MIPGGKGQILCFGKLQSQLPASHAVLLPSPLSKPKQTFLACCCCRRCSACKFSRHSRRRRRSSSSSSSSREPPGAVRARARRLSQSVAIRSAERLSPSRPLLPIPLLLLRLLLGDGVGLHISKLPRGEKEKEGGGAEDSSHHRRPAGMATRLHWKERGKSAFFLVGSPGSPHPVLVLLPPLVVLVHENVLHSPRQHPAYLFMQSGSGCGLPLVRCLDSLRKTHAPRGQRASLAIGRPSAQINEA